MAGPTVVYDSGKFSWLYTPPSVQQGAPATELRLKWGVDGINFPNVKVYGVTTLGADVHDVLPAGSTGQFHAKMVVWNGTKEGPESPIVPFVLGDGSAGGQIQFSVG